jgi:hypothetical protein
MRYTKDGYEFAIARSPRRLSDGHVEFAFRITNVSDRPSTFVLTCVLPIVGTDPLYQDGNTDELQPGQSAQYTTIFDSRIPKDAVLGEPAADITRCHMPLPPSPLRLNRIGGTFQEDGWLTEDPPRSVPRSAAGSLRPMDLRLLRTIEQWEAEDRSHLASVPSPEGMHSEDLAELAAIPEEYVIAALPDIRRYLHLGDIVQERGRGVFWYYVKGLKPAGWRRFEHGACRSSHGADKAVTTVGSKGDAHDAQ